MIYKLSFFTLILFVFIGCGAGNHSNSEEKTTDSKVTCQSTTNSILFDKSYQENRVKIEAPKSLKLLVSNTTKPIAKSSFDKEGLYTLFKTEYFWASETVKNLDLNNYSEPQQLIDDAKYSDDRWSFAVTPKAYNDAISQKSIGFGFSCQNINSGCLITYVRLNSPADKIDLRRGDVIQEINGTSATQELIYKKGQESQELTFKLLRSNGKELCQGKVTPSEYVYDVVANKILQTNSNEKVGYLRIDSFLGDDKILAKFNLAFNKFQKESIKKLIIDLRYNGGGSVDLASKLLDKLTINKEAQSQFTLAWNDNYQKNNQIYTFNKTSNSLELKQILFLTTQSSASASELIISAMKPYLPEEDVIIIGDRTHGKPVGMSAQSDGSYYYFLINFVVKNSLGFYNYFNGLAVTSGCAVADDPFHEMGDPKESMLKSALQYIDTGSCQ